MGSASLRLTFFERSIVEQGQRVHVQLSTVIEKDCCTSLPLEGHEEHLVAIRYSLYLELDLDVFKDGHELLTLGLLFVFLVRCLIDLLAKFEVHPPYRVRDCELLTLLTHLLSELRQYVLGRHGREKAMRALVRSIEVL